MRFTERSIEAIESRDTRFIAWDSANNGLGLRVAPSGTKTFVMVYRFDGALRMHTIGDTRGVTLGEARTAYHAAMEKVWKAKIARQHGETPSADLDPAAVKRKARVAMKSAPVMRDLWKAFKAKRSGGWRPKTASEYERMWLTYLAPLADRRARDVAPRDVKAILDAVAERGAIQSNRVRSLLAAVFHFAVDNFVVESSPVTAVRRVSKETPRDRALIDDAELRAMLVAMDDPAWPAAHRRAILLILATGCRPGEASGMQWSEIDEQGRTWTIPAERAKTGLPHVVPLSSFAYALLEEARTAGAVVKYPLADAPGAEPLARLTLSETVRTRQPIFDRHGVAPFRPHDLRRTCRSWLSKLRVPEQLAERCIGHVQRNILVKTYDRYEYLDEKREAFDKWGATLTALRAGDNVVAMRSKAAA